MAIKFSSTQRRVIITGASGLLGGWLTRQAPRGVIVFGQIRSRPLPEDWRPIDYRESYMDLTDPQALENLFYDAKPDAVIHTAARSIPSQCDNDPEGARKDNVAVPQKLMEHCTHAGIPFIHVSTDLVFEGTSAPYAEDGATKPLGMYAQSKCEAEVAIREYKKTLIIRPPLLLGCSPSGKRSSDENLKAAIEKGAPIPLFTDEYRTPMHAGFAAMFIWKLWALEQSGVFHIAGRTRVSRLELATQIAQKLGLDTTLFKPGSVKDFKGPYPRAADVSLNCQKLERLLCEAVPTLEESLSQPLAKRLPG